LQITIDPTLIGSSIMLTEGVSHLLGWLPRFSVSVHRWLPCSLPCMWLP